MRLGRKAGRRTGRIPDGGQAILLFIPRRFGVMMGQAGRADCALATNSPEPMRPETRHAVDS